MLVQHVGFFDMASAFLGGRPETECVLNEHIDPRQPQGRRGIYFGEAVETVHYRVAPVAGADQGPSRLMFANAMSVESDLSDHLSRHGVRSTPQTMRKAGGRPSADTTILSVPTIPPDRRGNLATQDVLFVSLAETPTAACQDRLEPTLAFPVRNLESPTGIASLRTR